MQHTYRDNDQHRIASGQSNQQIIDRRLHLRPRQNNHRNCIAEDPEETDQIDKQAVDNKVRQPVSVDLLIALERLFAAAVVAEVQCELASIVVTGSNRRRYRAYFHRSAILYLFTSILRCFSVLPPLHVTIFTISPSSASIYSLLVTVCNCGRTLAFFKFRSWKLHRIHFNFFSKVIFLSNIFSQNIIFDIINNKLINR